MSKPGKSLTALEETPIGVVPPPELLERFAIISTELPMQVVELWAAAHKRAYRFAMLSLLIGGILSLGLIGGFVYLVMQGHTTAAGLLLGSGALSLVAGFRSTRL